MLAVAMMAGTTMGSDDGRNNNNVPVRRTTGASGSNEDGELPAHWNGLAGGIAAVTNKAILLKKNSISIFVKFVSKTSKLLQKCNFSSQNR
jgi:hypothetical protein